MAMNRGHQKNVYIIGAQCTGKTTLVNALEASYQQLATNEVRADEQPRFIREVARMVLKEKNFTRDEIATSPARSFELQKYILEAQFKAEKAAANSTASSWYICDRSALDPIVYASVFVSKEAADEMMASPAWRELEKSMKQGLVFVCEAGCRWLEDDGIRYMPANVDEWTRIDNAFRKLLEERTIDYKNISKDLMDLEERVQLVKKAADADAVNSRVPTSADSRLEHL